MPANMTSVRLQVLNAIVAKFEGMQAEQPTNDPYGVTWSTVALGPLADFDQRKRYSLGVVAGPEKEDFSMPYIMSFLTVNVEFRITANRDDAAPGVLAERALTVVKRGLTEDRQWGGLAIDTKIVGSEVDLTTYADRSVVGVCQAQVQFRYCHLDPRDSNPDT
jgi:hypothetical protein